MNKFDFIKEAILVHGLRYLYLLDTYVSISKKVKIICPIHGAFEQKVSKHLSGCGCKKCSNKKISLSRIMTKDTFVSKAILKHGDKYDYSKFKYYRSFSKSIIGCPIHGDFEQRPNDHLNGYGCPKCGKEKSAKNSVLTQEEVIDRFKTIHGDKYDYSLVFYSKLNIPISIVCPTHGAFKQKPLNHLSGCGCQKCSSGFVVSKKETLIYDFINSIESFDKSIIQSYKTEWLNKKELDIYIPELSFGIEFNGLRWHNENHKDKWYHFDKTKVCKDNGVILLHIWEHYWNDPIKQEIYKSKIRHFLKMDNRIYARKCFIEPIDKTLAIDFVRQNHLEGFGIPYKNSKYIGLFKDEQLLMVAIYGEFYQQGKKSFVWKLQRVASLKDYTVVGGVSKISKYISNDIGNFVFQVTLDTGGTLVKQELTRKDVSLRYWWTKGNKFNSRNQSQVSLLKENELWTNGDTEDSFMIRTGWSKVWDSGIIDISTCF